MKTFEEIMKKEIIIRGLSQRTQEIYLRQMRKFIQHIKKSPDEVTLEDINNYQYYLKDKGIKWNSYNQSVCAIRFFYLNTIKRDWSINHIPYSRRKKKLPIVLSKQDIIDLYKTITYPKHKAMFLTLYSTGVRVSEIVNLKISDIDSKRMMIRIDQGKGNKDRYVVLSPKLLVSLRKYWKSMKVKPTKWLFPGANIEKKMCRKSVHTFVKKIQKKSGIKKSIHPHIFRHSFATHLLEAGVDIKRIQILMGHRNIQTTSVYFHVAEDYTSKVKTPLDIININY
ncbi:MAG: site-specific integrase [Spirochaetes bacterium]|nr:site-specific integrase [Spirochaetota bacterium]